MARRYKKLKTGITEFGKDVIIFGQDIRVFLFYIINIDNMPKKQKTYLFDGTDLCCLETKNHARSGVLFVAYNLLKALLARSDITVKIYCAKGSFEGIGNILKKWFADYPDIEIISPAQQPVSAKAAVLKDKYKASYSSKHYFKAAGRYARWLFYSIGERRAKKRFWPKKLKNIDVFFSSPNPAPKIIAQNLNIKKGLVLHDIHPLLFPAMFSDRNDDNFFLTRIARTFSDNSYTYFANSANTAKDFLENYPALSPARVNIIPLGCNGSYFPLADRKLPPALKHKYNIPQNKEYILTLCSLRPQKNLKFAAENFMEFIKVNSINNLIFVMAGAIFDEDVKYCSEFTNFINKSGGKIALTGYVDDEDMNALYNGAQFFVLPSLYEGFGIPVLEAMASGTPVVCSNTGALPEVIDGCGLTFDPKNPASFINALSKMYFDASLREISRANGLKRAKLYSWEKAADIIVSAFSGK